MAIPTTIMSLCAGIGGLDLGLHIAMPRSRVVCYVEREAYAASVIVARMADKTLDEAPIWSDLESFDGKPWRGVVDIITSGDPCQPFSCAGKRLGEADERYVWDDVARIIREVAPPLVFLENVPGAIEFRFECRKQLEGMGYRVEAGLFSAEEVGAPHERERIFLLAHASGPRAKVGLPRQEYGKEGNAGIPDYRGCFPPPPDALATWGKVVQEEPRFEPAVRRISHGTSNRNDRLRALGNAVVPATAALAFVTLWQRLQGER